MQRARLVIAASLAMTGCATAAVPGGTETQSYYRTGIPEVGLSRSIEAAFRSIKRLSTSAVYTTYVFPESAGVTEDDLLDGDPIRLERTLALASEVTTHTESKAGSAAVVGHAGRRVALITNDHVTRFPAVRLSYFHDRGGGGDRSARRVASASFRAHEYGGLIDHAELGPYEVLARDSVVDLAVVELALPRRRDADDFPILPVLTGNPYRLRWGSVVYALGYPLGYRIATRAIVSDPNRDGIGGFITDGLWNEGVSGGVILAVREEDGSLEWVGMTRAGAGQPETRLQPRRDPEMEEPAGARLYQGPIYAEDFVRIQYGITLPIAITAVRSFLSRHERTLRRAGYDLSDL